MPTPQYDIVTIGSSLRDIIFYANTGEITHKQVWELQYGGKIMSDRVFLEHGGGASNTAVSFARLGLRTAIISSIGKDEYGESIRAHLRDEGVDVRMLSFSKRHTGFSFVLVHQRTGEHIAFIHYGAAEECVLPKKVQDVRTKWFYVSSLNTTEWPSIMQKLSAHTAQIAWNPGNTQLRSSRAELEKALLSVDTLIVNEEEIHRLNAICGLSARTIEQHIRTAYTRGPRIIVVTRGRKGSIAFDGKRVYRLPAVRTKPVDTTGAGDSYGSAFIAGLIAYKGDIQRSMQLAAHNSERNVAMIGAQSGLVKRSDLPKYLQ